VLNGDVELDGAPVIYEEHPTYQNLVGRIEHRARMGALSTDLMLIKPGALHRANGGYLILEAHELLRQPYAWEGLIRALRTRQIRIESLGQMLGALSTVTLEPEPIDLDVKVVLLGERRIFHLFDALDPQFADLFKVQVDFEEHIRRTDNNVRLFARLLTSIVKDEELLPFDAEAVARIVERGSRLAADSDKLSVQRRDLVELLRESDYWAREAGRRTVVAKDVQRTVDSQVHRADRLRERAQEEIDRGNLLIDVDSSKVGQVNGLAVYQLGRFAFGRPTRITARVRLGSGKVTDIERESELGQPLHSKGVMILSGFLAGHYVPDRPLSLAASLVFEQSYGGVDGDSASSAELYALLSALAGVPLRQSLAVTGSVNQLGRIQPIGGVNEKIEGFFDVCRARGLTGDQGVLIPEANVKNLMLRRDVIEAVEDRAFHVYAVTTVQEGIELLTGTPAGVRDEHGCFPADTFHRRVEDRLAEFAERAAAFLRFRAAEDVP
jgi:lon-related putative ATP-dependent protease